MKAMADCLIVPKAEFRANERLASERINKMNHFEWLTTQQLLKLGMESGELRSLPLFLCPVNELTRRKCSNDGGCAIINDKEEEYVLVLFGSRNLI